LRRPRFHYGWIVVAIAFVTMGVAISARTAFSLLFPEILAEFDWDRGTTAGAFSAGFVMSTAMLPLVGMLMERYGVRVTIPLGAVLVAGGYAYLATITSPVGLYLAMGLLIVNGSMAMSYIVHSIFLPNWFVRHRGLAVGIAFAGVGIGGITILPALQSVIDSYGWRQASLGLAGLIVAVVIPLNLLFQRNHPSDMGLEPDGGRAGSERPAAGGTYDTIVDRDWTAVEWTVAKAVRTSRFWYVFTGFFAALFVWYAIQAHQTKFLIEAGFDAGFAAAALGFVAFCGIFGQIGIGALSDRIGREHAWAVALSGYVACGLLLMAINRWPQPLLVYAMIAAQGLLGNGLAAIYGAITIEIFSGRRIASIIAIVSLGGNLGAAAGVWLLGEIFDRTGSYLLGFWACVAAALLSMALIWLAAPGKVRMVGGKAQRLAKAGAG